MLRCGLKAPPRGSRTELPGTGYWESPGTRWGGHGTIPWCIPPTSPGHSDHPRRPGVTWERQAGLTMDHQDALMMGHQAGTLPVPTWVGTVAPS